MLIVANGILLSQKGDVLLIQRNDTRTFAPPGGALEAGELPTDGVAREVREETGLIVMPVRLASLSFLPVKPQPYLAFIFRCLLRGGEIQPSPESPHVGFYPYDQLPRPMASIHRRRIETAVAHSGGPVIWQTDKLNWQSHLGYFILNNVVYRYYAWQRRRGQGPPYQPPPSWQITVRTVAQNPQGDVLWLEGGGQWQLPGGLADDQIPPWETAVSLTPLPSQLTNLTGVYTAKNDARMTLVFTAVTNQSTSLPSAHWFPPDQPPQTTPSQNQYLQDALGPSEITLFRSLPD
ncbi:MAG TPA: NUDIX domain-containing protein [Anaerolineae bacterium]|nr:NUDIX domain-containing protein [Anaerolineae bacterium]HIP71455.1 NUDIX domain-containing protein [Anaerolineae bacterium]